jgi:hypothetical protein
MGSVFLADVHGSYNLLNRAPPLITLALALVPKFELVRNDCRQSTIDRRQVALVTSALRVRDLVAGEPGAGCEVVGVAELYFRDLVVVVNESSDRRGDLEGMFAVDSILSVLVIALKPSKSINLPVLFRA